MIEITYLLKLNWSVLKLKDEHHQYMSRKKPLKPNHAELFGLMHDYGPPQEKGDKVIDYINEEDE